MTWRRWKRRERKRSALRKRNMMWARCACLAGAAAMIAVGIVRQEYVLVLQKAVRICLECIGIG